MTERTKLLVSVRSIKDVETVQGLDIDIIDLKDPTKGPLGMMEIIEVKEIIKINFTALPKSSEFPSRPFI